jgi:uncharacterized damage-inducible protein DinB
MTASLHTELMQLSRYNRIANRELYECCGRLSERELGQPCPNRNESLLFMLNHILIVDRDWMNRFTGTEIANAERGTLLHDNLPALKTDRVKEDERIEEFVENIRIAFLSTQFRYKDAGGAFHQDPADRLVVHMFINQIHHRSRVQQVLAETGHQAPELDFHILLRR